MTREFERLDLIPITDDSHSEAFGRELQLNTKDPEILPYNRNSVQPSDTSVNLLNASLIKIFSNGRQVISAQTPLPSSVEGLIRVVMDHSARLIVAFHDQGEESLYCPERAGSSINVGDFRVKNISEVEDEESGNVKLQISAPRFEKRTVKLIKFGSWDASRMNENDTRSACSKIDRLVQTVASLWEENTTMVMHCRDGSSFCGSLCALLLANERLKLENRIDLFRIVKDLRDMRPRMVRTLDQYIMCHQVIELMIESLQTYANF